MFSLFRVVWLGSVCFPVSRVWGLFVCYCVCEVTYRFRTPSLYLEAESRPSAVKLIVGLSFWFGLFST